MSAVMKETKKVYKWLKELEKGQSINGTENKCVSMWAFMSCILELRIIKRKKCQTELSTYSWQIKSVEL